MSALTSMNSGDVTGAAFAKNFSTKELPQQDQFDAWRSFLSGAIDLLPDPDASKPFEADFSSWTFGDAVLTRVLYTNAPARHWRHRPRSYMDHWCVVLSYSDLPELGTFFLAPPRQGSVSFRSLAMPFEGQAHDTEVLTLYLPRDFCRDELEDFGRAHDLAIEPRMGALLAAYMDNLARQLPHIPAGQAQGLATPTRSLVAACIAPRGERSEAAEVPLAALQIDRARVFVRQNMASPGFGPEQLARLMAMSRSKLYRLFESTGGVAHFINRERLREAYRRLGAHRDAVPIYAIGNDVGFIDHSTFSRAFRREFGYSPSEARERNLTRFPARSYGLSLQDLEGDDASSLVGNSEGDNVVCHPARSLIG